MTQSVYSQRVKVNACCFITNSLPGIYTSLTDYCKKGQGINSPALFDIFYSILHQ
jgi:hypothetical protein